jgi:hypothetical protein
MWTIKKLYIDFAKHCILFSMILISGCGGCTDYSVNLPNGYQLVCTNAPSVYIFHETTPYGGFKFPDVPPKIVRLNDIHGIVFGLVEVSPDSDFGSTKAPGYFILDTEKRKVWLGLSETKWLQILKDYGIAEKPLLVRPSTFHYMHLRLR